MKKTFKAPISFYHHHLDPSCPVETKSKKSNYVHKCVVCEMIALIVQNNLGLLSVLALATCTTPESVVELIRINH